MYLNMFLDACENIAKITRIMSLDQGHTLLLGTGGKGRCCLARLSCFLSKHKLLEAGVN